MAAQPPSLTWKELLNMSPVQGAQFWADRTTMLTDVQDNTDQLSAGEALAAARWLGDVTDLLPFSLRNDPVFMERVRELRHRLSLRAHEHPAQDSPEYQEEIESVGKSSNIGGSGSISIDPVEFEANFDAPPEAIKAAPIEVSQIDIGPLADTGGKAVILDDLAGLTLKSSGDYFSETVKQTLNDAAHTPEFVTGDGMRVITPYSYLRSAYFDGGNAGEKKGDRTAHDFLTEWLNFGPDGPRPLNLSLVAEEAGPVTETNTAVSADLVAMLAHGATVVQETHLRQKRVDARHVLAAFFLFPEGLQAFVDMDALDGGPAIFFRALRHAFLEHILDQATRAENKQAWADVFAPLDEDSHFDGLRLNQLVTVHYPDYASDTPGTLEGDQLNVADDARALADLICLNDADPPLAVGLFGNWGAGKSTFMQMIEEAIGENTDKVREARRLQQIGRIPFVERVVHIRFNAWHYLDANLWASLVTHIFRELHRQSSDPTGNQDWLSETKVDALIDRLEVVRQVEKDARLKLDTIQSSIDVARTTLKTLEDQKAEKKKALIGDYALTLADAVDTREELDSAMKTLGLAETVATVGQLSSVVSEVRTLGGRVKLLASTAANGRDGAWWFILLGIAVFVALGAVPFLAQEFGAQGWVKALTGQVGGAVSAMGGLTAWLLPHISHVNKKLKPVFDAHKQVLEKQEQLARDKADAQKALDKLNAEQANKERELETALLERERLEEIARGDRPTELLTRFIEDRASAEGYRKHLGLLSHIRRDFETMSDLMRKQRKQIEEGKSEDPKLPRIDRIVLYIDDLDRCRDGQVVEVLEAIHLLLAFDLFVVVVGVDARWLQHSLKQFYDKQLSVAETPEDGKPTVADYLEKIFQVPFHLSPLELGEGGSYGRLMDKLVGEVTISSRNADDGGPDPAAQPIEDDEAKAGDTKDGKTLRTLDLVLPVIEETPEETMQRVMLSDRELDMMRRLGPLVGRSPRAVKRFVNLYRLMRTRRRGADLEAFLNSPKDGVEPFKVYLLWLGLETKLTPVQLSNLKALLLYAYNGRLNGSVTIGSRLSKQPKEQYNSEAESKAIEHLRKELWASMPDVDVRRPVLTEIEAVYSVTLATLREVIAEVSRYSFHMRG